MFGILQGVWESNTERRRITAIVTIRENEDYIGALLYSYVGPPPKGYPKTGFRIYRLGLALRCRAWGVK